MNQAVKTSHAPSAIGPYSQAVLAGTALFISGQLPIDPVSGEMTKDDIVEQTHRTLKNIEAILNQANLSMNQVVKTTVFLKDINDFAKMNEVYAEYFCGEILPARAAIQVAALPKNARIEIEVIAVR